MNKVRLQAASAGVNGNLARLESSPNRQPDRSLQAYKENEDGRQRSRRGPGEVDPSMNGDFIRENGRIEENLSRVKGEKIPY
jgi:hypothetical protein